MQMVPIQKRPQTPISFFNRKVKEEDLMRQLAKYEGEKDIAVISMVKCDLEIEVLQRISISEWKNVYHLSISMSKLGWSGCKMLAKTNLPFLEYLNIQGNNLQSNSIQHLCRASFTQLVRLGLANNRLTSDAIKTLSRGKLPGLRQLQLSNNPISYPGLQTLPLVNLADPRNPDDDRSDSSRRSQVDVRRLTLSESEGISTVRNLASRYPATILQLN